MRNSLLYGLILAIFLSGIITACSKAPSDARKELMKRNIPYAESEFIDRARKGDANAVKLFLDAGINPDVRDENGNTALIYAAEKGNAAIVKALIAKYADVNLRNNSGVSAILTARLQGYEKIETILRKAGARESKPDLDKALLDAVSKGDVDKVKDLLEQGADPGSKDANGQTTLDIAKTNQNSAIISLLKSSHNNLTSDVGLDAALLQVSLSGDTAKVKDLLIHGANINVQDKDGRTALMVAAYRGHNEVAALLLSYYADLNIKDNDGLTALMLAAGFGHADIVRLLLSKGSVLDVKVETGKYAGLTALKFASHEGYAEIVKMLEDAGAKE